jgi:hypothetical protein
MPDAFARLVRRMMEQGQVPRSQMSPRSQKELSSLFDAGVLTQTRSGGGLVVEVKDLGTLAEFYRKRYPSEGKIIAGPPRACAVGTLRNAKRVNRTNREPILLRAFSPVTCARADAQCDLQTATNQTGAVCLILETDRFWSMTATIAVVENLECFLHFEKMNVPADVALYAAGRLSDLALQWLGSPELSHCRFIHCGDYDPVGLDEFLRLKTIVGDRARLHFPPNLPDLIRIYGRNDLLRDSEAILKRLRATTDPTVRSVLQTLDETGCGLEQEVLLLVELPPRHGADGIDVLCGG